MPKSSMVTPLVCALVSEDEFALVFDAAGTMLRVTQVQELAPAKYTVLGWQVHDIVQAAKDLQKAHVAVERYRECSRMSSVFGTRLVARG